MSVTFSAKRVKEIDPEELGDRVRRARRALRLPQATFAKNTVVGLRTLQKIEAGNYKGSRLVLDLLRAFEALGVRPEWLLEGKEPILDAQRGVGRLLASPIYPPSTWKEGTSWLATALERTAPGPNEDLMHSILLAIEEASAEMQDAGYAVSPQMRADLFVALFRIHLIACTDPSTITPATVHRFLGGVLQSTAEKLEAKISKKKAGDAEGGP